MQFYNYRDVTLSGAQIDLELNNGTYRGVIDNMPNSKYHSLKSYISSTNLKYMYANSPLHYKANILDGASTNTQSDAMIRGSLFHAMLLTPDEVQSEFYIIPKVDRRTKAGKEEFESATARSNGRTLITDDIFSEVSNMVDSAMSSKHVRRLLEIAKKEVSYFWKCPFSGLNFKAKADACCPEYMIEVKTSRSARPSVFDRLAYNMNYDLSAYHYLEGMRIVSGDMPRMVYFIVVESDAPYVTQVYKASDSFLELGHKKWLESTTLLAKSLENNVWPGYDQLDEILELSAPAWALPKDEVIDSSFANKEDEETF